MPVCSLKSFTAVARRYAFFQNNKNKNYEYKRKSKQSHPEVLPNHSQHWFDSSGRRCKHLRFTGSITRPHREDWWLPGSGRQHCLSHQPGDGEGGQGIVKCSDNKSQIPGEFSVLARSEARATACPPLADGNLRGLGIKGGHVQNTNSKFQDNSASLRGCPEARRATACPETYRESNLISGVKTSQS